MTEAHDDFKGDQMKKLMAIGFAVLAFASVGGGILISEHSVQRGGIVLGD